MAATASHQSKPVLWMCCGAMTDQLTLASLKKIGNEKSSILSASLPDQASSFQPASSATTNATGRNPRLTIRSIPALIDQAIELSHLDSENSKIWDEELFVKTLFGIVKDWVNDVSRENPTTGAWIVLDDVSTLAALIGEQLTYGLTLSIHALVASMSQSFGLAMRCTNDNVHADEFANPAATRPTTDWFGGGQDDTNDNVVPLPPWERTLVELADTIVDVVPLASGYTRDAHGRLYLTGRTSHVSLVYNYCLTENQVLVIRINNPSPHSSKGR